MLSVMLGTTFLMLLCATISDAQTCDQKYKIVSGHSACKTANLYSSTSASGVSDAEKNEILDYHNTVRGLVLPPATNMLNMTWDDALANIAQKWASHCQYGHDTGYNRADYGRLRVGQNIAMSYNLVSWTAVMTDWKSEDVNFNYNVTTNATIGHYTQMVWATTNKIGCGFAECSVGWPVSGKYYVCNYGPAGNAIGEKTRPYAIGLANNETDRCSDCPSTCADGLCDCGVKTCLNGGTMDPNTCGCTCLNNGYVSSNDCALDCDLVSDQSPLCNAATFVCEWYGGAQCPYLCNWCSGD